MGWAKPSQAFTVPYCVAKAIVIGKQEYAVIEFTCESDRSIATWKTPYMLVSYVNVMQKAEEKYEIIVASHILFAIYSLSISMCVYIFFLNCRASIACEWI